MVDGVTSVLLICLGITVVGEFAVSSTWSDRWFRSGPILWRQIVPNATTFLNPERLQEKTRQAAWPTLAFHRFSPRSIGFRESMWRSPFTVPYVPLMRGEIQVEPTSGSAQIIGRANFMPIGVVAMAFLVIRGIGADLTAVVLFGLLMAIHFWWQTIRFGHVTKVLSS
jgi:hypothetical protein